MNHPKVISLICLLLWGTSAVRAQTAETRIAEGRAALAAEDLVTAQARFAQARALEPANQTAAALLGLTRFFALSEAAATQAYLDRAGVSPEGRDLFDETASPSLTTDIEGNVVLPANYNLIEAAAFWKDTVVPVSTQARTDLAAVTAPGFTLALSAAETGGADLTLDQGDVLMVRAALSALEFFVHYLHGQNLDLNLDGLTTLVSGDVASIQRILADNPSLLGSGSATRRLMAQAALGEVIARYREASDFIRARPEGLMRLFMLDPEDFPAEEEFRAFLDDLEQSVTQPIYLSFEGDNNPPLVHSAPLFGASQSWRAQLPAFSETGFNPTTIPDATLGGFVLEGLTRGNIAGFLESTNTAIEFGPLTNDHFADAQSLTGPSGSVAGHNLSATGEPGEPIHFTEYATSSSVWYRWTSTATGWVAFDTTGSEIDTVLVVYTGTAFTNLVKVNENDEGGVAYHQSGRTSRAVFRVNAGTTYRMAVGAWTLDEEFNFAGETEGELGRGLIELSWGYVTPPSNDAIASAEIIAGVAGSVTGDNRNATGEDGVPEFPNKAAATSVWYRWTAPDSGSVLFSVLPDETELFTGLQLRAYSQTPTGWTPVLLTGDSPAQAVVTAGAVYYLGVGGSLYGYRSGFTLEWEYGENSVSPFDNWRNSNFSSGDATDPTISGPTVVLSGDGVSNLMRFALGYSAYEPLPGELTTLTREGNHWVFSYARQQGSPGVIYRVLTTTVLSDPNSWTEAGVTHQFRAASGNREIWEGRFPTGGAQRFFRLEVELPSTD